MLELAYNHKEQLDKKYSRMLLNPDKYKWVLPSWVNYEVKIDDNTWNRLQYVSVIKNEVIGYIECEIDRQCYYAHKLVLINFENKPSFVFSKDFYRFLKLLFFSFNLNKITFSCIVGNPIEKTYDKLINKIGGRIVGIFKREVKLLDGLIYDMKFYEVTKENIHFHILKL